MLFRSLRRRYVVFGTITTLTISDHLYATYANISSNELQDNHDLLQAPYEANLPIEALINQVEVAV